MAVSLLALAGAAALSATLVAPSEFPNTDRCPAQGVTQAKAGGVLLRPQDRRGDAGAQTLGSLPPARMEVTVLRSVAGCTLPVVMREDVQADGRLARPR